MYKNQLQELAQRSCFNLPAYACVREGPDHAPRFKASVTFNGEVFESPGYCGTLRQAEHAAAEVALSTLSTRGPAQSLAARILDETGVCKNLLQETAQRAGVSLPVYTTERSGPGHLPSFTCRVEVAGMSFWGETAKTKKQAEKNAAMAAWSALKKYANKGHAAANLEAELTEEQEQNMVSQALASAKDVKEAAAIAAQHVYAGPSRHSAPAVMARPLELEHLGALPTGGPLYRPRSYAPRGLEAPTASSLHMAPVMKVAQMAALPAPNAPLYTPRHTSLKVKPGASYQPMVRPQFAPAPPPHGTPRSSGRPAGVPLGPGIKASVVTTVRREVSVVQSDHEADEAAWLQGEALQMEAMAADMSMPPSMVWQSNMAAAAAAQQWWGQPPAYLPAGSASAQMAAVSMAQQGMMHRHHSEAAIAGPVRLRTMVPVHATPPRLVEEEEEERASTTQGEAATRQVLSQLSL